MDNQELISRKYAQAFLNIYIEKISLENFKSIKKLSEFLNNHKKIMFYFDIPNINNENKTYILNEILKNFNLLEVLKSLIELLLKHKRLYLIYEVLNQIIYLYKQRKNIMIFRIASSHPLDKYELQVVEKFLSHSTGKKIISEYSLDKNLVAGIKLLSGTMLWEYSISKQCKTLHQQFNLQGTI